MIDFRNTDYLAHGTDAQRKCFRILERSGIMTLLDAYDPVVAGTIPIGIDIHGSDIDILCSTGDFLAVEKILRENFGDSEGFSSSFMRESFVCSFVFDGMEIEVFAQDEPVTEQNGYRHMITEYALLEIHGERFREEIIRLKQSGIKTEPAFARLLNLPGDPYEAVLEKGRELGFY